MKYTFYGYYLGLLCKGKFKLFQIFLTGTVIALVAFVNFNGILNFILGKTDSLMDLLSLLAFIYALMNFAYALFNQNSLVPSSSASSPKIENISANLKNEKEDLKNKNRSSSILANKNYGSSVKSSPKVMTKTENLKESGNPVHAASPGRVPELEINIDSTQEFFKEEKSEWKQYSGAISDNYTLDIADVKEIEENISDGTPLPDTRTALYERVRNTKYF